MMEASFVTSSDGVGRVIDITPDDISPDVPGASVTRLGHGFMSINLTQSQWDRMELNAVVAGQPYSVSGTGKLYHVYEGRWHEITAETLPPEMYPVLINKHTGAIYTFDDKPQAFIEWKQDGCLSIAFCVRIMSDLNKKENT